MLLVCLTPSLTTFSVRKMKKYQVWRPHYSSYLSSTYKASEKARIEALPDCIYVDKPDPSFKLIILSNTHVPLSMVENYLPQTELIIHANSGFDNLISFAPHIQCPVVLGNEIRALAVTEWILSALFQTICPIETNFNWKEGRNSSRRLLSDHHILILGHGMIGQKISTILKALNAQVSISDPYLNLQAENGPYDGIIVCASLNPQNKGLVDEKLLSSINPQGFIINSARGELVKENELISLLKNRPDLKAYLDVFSPEPTDPKLWENLKNVVVTPHKAGVYNKLEDEMIHFCQKVLRHFIEWEKKDFLQHYHSCLMSDRKRGHEWI
jgi:D-3-phosphoglycerate dehydrogenase / 2-oxoglutarate reductase